MMLRPHFLLPIFALCLISCSKHDLRSNENFGSQIGTGIVGGTEIKEEARWNSDGNYVVGIQSLVKDPSTGKIGAMICTGSLIAPDLVLTAAHCLGSVASPQDVIVIYSENFMTDVIAGSVKSFVLHPKSKNGESDSNDVALIRLNFAAPEWKKIVRLADWHLNFVSALGVNAKLVGFGKTHGSLDPNRPTGIGILRETDAVAKLDILGGVWAVNQKTGHGLCSGDSGSPLLVRWKKEVYVLGVARSVLYRPHSKGSLPLQPEVDQCADQGQYTPTYKVHSFIKENLLALKKNQASAK